MIDLYTAPTPNGHKASCALEELGIDYTVKVVDISSGEQHTPDVQGDQSQWPYSGDSRQGQ